MPIPVKILSSDNPELQMTTSKINKARDRLQDQSVMQ